MSAITPFEYAMVLVSIVLGLGIAQILAGIADLIQNSGRIRVYGPYLAWLPLVFFLQIQAWWLFYGLRDRDVWHLPVFFFAIMYPIGLFILARLLFPEMSGDGLVRLRDFYYTQYRKLFFGVAALAAITLAENWWLYHRPLLESVIPAALMVVMAGIAILRLQQEWLHRALVVILLLVMVAATALNWRTWSLGP